MSWLPSSLSTLAGAVHAAASASIESLRHYAGGAGHSGSPAAEASLPDIEADDGLFKINRSTRYGHTKDGLAIIVHAQRLLRIYNERHILKKEIPFSDILYVDDKRPRPQADATGRVLAAPPTKRGAAYAKIRLMKSSGASQRPVYLGVDSNAELYNDKRPRPQADATGRVLAAPPTKRGAAYAKIRLMKSSGASQRPVYLGFDSGTELEKFMEKALAILGTMKRLTPVPTMLTVCEDVPDSKEAADGDATPTDDAKAADADGGPDADADLSEEEDEEPEVKRPNPVTPDDYLFPVVRLAPAAEQVAQKKSLRRPTPRLGNIRGMQAQSTPRLLTESPPPRLLNESPPQRLLTKANFSPMTSPPMTTRGVVKPISSIPEGRVNGGTLADLSRGAAHLKNAKAATPEAADADAADRYHTRARSGAYDVSHLDMSLPDSESHSPSPSTSPQSSLHRRSRHQARSSAFAGSRLTHSSRQSRNGTTASNGSVDRSPSPSVDVDGDMPPQQTSMARSKSAHPDFAQPKPLRAAATKYERNLKHLLNECEAGRKRHLSFDFQHHKFRVFDLNINLTEVDIPISQIEKVTSVGKHTRNPENMIVIMGRHVVRTPAERVTIYFRESVSTDGDSSNSNSNSTDSSDPSRSATSHVDGKASGTSKDWRTSKTLAMGSKGRKRRKRPASPPLDPTKPPRSIDIQFENTFDETYFCGLCKEFGIALKFEDMEKMYKCNRAANNSQEKHRHLRLPILEELSEPPDTLEHPHSPTATDSSKNLFESGSIIVPPDLLMDQRRVRCCTKRFLHVDVQKKLVELRQPEDRVIFKFEDIFQLEMLEDVEEVSQDEFLLFTNPADYPTKKKKAPKAPLSDASGVRSQSNSRDGKPKSSNDEAPKSRRSSNGETPKSPKSNGDGEPPKDAKAAGDQPDDAAPMMSLEDILSVEPPKKAAAKGGGAGAEASDPPSATPPVSAVDPLDVLLAPADGDTPRPPFFGLRLSFDAFDEASEKVAEEFGGLHSLSMPPAAASTPRPSLQRSMTTRKPAVFESLPETQEGLMKLTMRIVRRRMTDLGALDKKELQMTVLFLTEASRQQFLDCLEEACPMNSKTRQNIVAEIVSSEEKYLEDLTAIEREFYEPISSRKILKPPQIEGIFSNFDQIIQFHRIFLAQMRISDAIPQLFQKFGKFLLLYIDYLKKYDERVATLQSLRKHRKLNAFFKEQAKKNLREISSYLITPVQRIPRYILLLEQLRKHTPKRHVEYGVLEEQCNRLLDIGMHVDRSRSTEERPIVVISHKVKGALPFPLVMPWRKFILGDTLNVVRLPPADSGTTLTRRASSEKRRLKLANVYLLTDILFWTSSTHEAMGSRDLVTLTVLPLNTKSKSRFLLELSTDARSATDFDYEDRPAVSSLMDAASSFTSKLTTSVAAAGTGSTAAAGGSGSAKRKPNAAMSATEPRGGRRKSHIVDERKGAGDSEKLKRVKSEPDVVSDMSPQDVDIHENFSWQKIISMDDPLSQMKLASAPTIVHAAPSPRPSPSPSPSITHSPENSISSMESGASESGGQAAKDSSGGEKLHTSSLPVGGGVHKSSRTPTPSVTSSVSLPAGRSTPTPSPPRSPRPSRTPELLRSTNSHQQHPPTAATSNASSNSSSNGTVANGTAHVSLKSPKPRSRMSFSPFFSSTSSSSRGSSPHKPTKISVKSKKRSSKVRAAELSPVRTAPVSSPKDKGRPPPLESVPSNSVDNVNTARLSPNPTPQNTEKRKGSKKPRHGRRSSWWGLGFGRADKDRKEEREKAAKEVERERSMSRTPSSTAGSSTVSSSTAGGGGDMDTTSTATSSLAAASNGAGADGGGGGNQLQGDSAHQAQAVPVIRFEFTNEAARDKWVKEIQEAKNAIEKKSKGFHMSRTIHEQHAYGGASRTPRVAR